MYTYNKNDNSYTFSSDDLENLVDIEIEPDDNGEEKEDEEEENNEVTEIHEKPKKIQVINGGNDLDISPVSDYIEVEKPRNEKRENIAENGNKKVLEKYTIDKTVEKILKYIKRVLDSDEYGFEKNI